MYKRRIFTAQENAEILEVNPDYGLHHAILRESSVTDEFYFESCTNEDGSESVSVVDPIIILFNQQRLDDMGFTATQAFLDALQPKSNELAELRKKCSDEDLMSMMKSRHLQSPAEILAWCRYMQSNVDTFNAEVQKLVEAQQSEVQKQQNVEPSKT